MFGQTQNDGIEMLPTETVDFGEFVAAGPAAALRLDLTWTGAVDSATLAVEIAKLLTAVSEREKALGGLGMVAHPQDCQLATDGRKQTLTVLLRPCDARWSAERCDRLAGELAQSALPPAGDACESLHETVRGLLPLTPGRCDGQPGGALMWTAHRVAA